MERAFGHLKMVFRILTGIESYVKTDKSRIPMYVISCIVMHNFLKDLGHVVDEEEAHQFQRRNDGGHAGQAEGPAESAGAVAREYRDRLRRLWVEGAAE